MAGAKTIKKTLGNLKNAKTETELFLLTKSMGVKLSMKEVHELWTELHPEDKTKQPDEKKGILAKLFRKK